ncbi:hypothetical protein INR49_003641 [Caranx melampygus]|nr:hypothetical protein INR49_003641 [Caranx melampygus]
MVKDKDQTHQVTLQRFEWGPSGGLQQVNQQKRTTLLQRSARRVEAIKAKGALARMKSGNQTSSETREKSKAGKCQPVSSETKTEPERQHGSNHKVKGRRAEQQQTDRSGFKLKQAQLPLQSDSRPKKMNVPNIHTPEQRKLDVSEMHQRTRRLYEQLEEVKHQKTIRSKQEAYAKNRQKAKEFHMLQGCDQRSPQPSPELPPSWLPYLQTHGWRQNVEHFKMRTTLPKDQCCNAHELTLTWNQASWVHRRMSQAVIKSTPATEHNIHYKHDCA